MENKFKPGDAIRYTYTHHIGSNTTRISKAGVFVRYVKSKIVTPSPRCVVYLKGNLGNTTVPEYRLTKRATDEEIN
jgi:hypothetical protein